MRGLDETDEEILDILLDDGRKPYSEIAEAVGLSAPAVSDRIDRLREIAPDGSRDQMLAVWFPLLDMSPAPHRTMGDRHLSPDDIAPTPGAQTADVIGGFQFTAAPPLRKLSTICAVTAAGKAMPATTLIMPCCSTV